MSTSPVKKGLWTLEFGEIGATLKALQDHGLAPEHLVRVRSDPEFAKKIVEFILRDGINIPAQLQFVSALLGQNFMSESDWATFYGAKFNKKQHRMSLKFPWGEDILNSPCPFNKGKLIKETHVAFFGLPRLKNRPLTVAEWMKIHPANGTEQPKIYNSADHWSQCQPYADEATLEPRWHLLLKEIAPDSTGKKPEDLIAMLPEEYELPTSIAETTKNLFVYKKTGKFVNYSRWALCAEKTKKTPRVAAGLFSCVGNVIENGVSVYRWDGSPNDSIGLGASRKFSA